MTALKSKRAYAKKQTQQMKQKRKHKITLQDEWMQVDNIKEHLDNMTKNK
jgi:hypothetical protein|tara:strand:- start:216 stop:365 length:150 start_codon:yes stop_codon:yes gene_type:complete